MAISEQQMCRVLCVLCVSLQSRRLKALFNAEIAERRRGHGEIQVLCVRSFKATARLRALGPSPKSTKHANSFDITRGTDVAKGAAQSRSVAVIGRKRSAQGSWDDACTPGLKLSRRRSKTHKRPRVNKAYKPKNLTKENDRYVESFFERRDRR